MRKYSGNHNLDVVSVLSGNARIVIVSVCALLFEHQASDIRFGLRQQLACPHNAGDG